MPKDVLLGNDLDLVFRNGDLVVGESTEQHQQLLLLNDKGHIKHAPIAGVGIGGYLNDDNLGELHGEIQQQFERDGLRITKLKIFENGRLEINAGYEG
jgi:hypothetical protein